MLISTVPTTACSRRVAKEGARQRLSFVKRLIGGACVACLCSLMVILSGCGNSDAAAAKDALSSELASLQNDDQRTETAARLFQSVGFYPEDYGVSTDVFAQEYFKEFSFSVGGDELASQEDSLVLPYQVTVPVMAEVLETLDEAKGAAIFVDPENYDDGYADAAFQEACAEADWQQDTLELNITMAKDAEGAWSVLDPATLAAGLLDGFDPRQV